MSMTIDEALKFADEWSRGVTIYPGAQGWRVVCMLLADEVRRLRSTVEDLVTSDNKVIVDLSTYVETLEQKIADKDGEIERYKQSPTVETCRKMIEEQAVVENAELHKQLANANR